MNLGRVTWRASLTAELGVGSDLAIESVILARVYHAYSYSGIYSLYAIYEGFVLMGYLPR